MPEFKLNKSRKPCWEYMGCGVDMACCGHACPAYPKDGMSCWSTAGTLGGDMAKSRFAKELSDCRSCRFYIYINTA
jgi:hypothetical protein